MYRILFGISCPNDYICTSTSPFTPFLKLLFWLVQTPFQYSFNLHLEKKGMPHYEKIEQPQDTLGNQPIIDSSPDQHNDVSTVYWHPAILCTLMYLLMGIGYFISTAPQLRLLESIICQQYYEGSESSGSEAGIPEHLCKEGPVQAALAQLLGWQSFFDNIPGLLLALPYGILTDKYGRRLK